MATLRTQTAAKLLRSTTSRTAFRTAAVATQQRRLQTSDATVTGLTEAKKEAEEPVERMPKPATAPDYGAHIDRATSTFTPVPKRVLDGSEPGDLSPAAVLSGAPMELQARQVRIYKPTKPATQSGNWGGRAWRMDWDILPKGHRWENPLMGWQSSGDYMQGTHLTFKSKEDAIAFAEKQGYEYYVQEPKVRAFAPKAYANNFLYSAGKLKHVRTK